MIDHAHFELWSSKYWGLAWSFQVNPSSCGNPEYFENYIRFCAIGDNQSGLSTTHAFLDDDENQLMGFVSLKLTSVLHEYNGYTLGDPALEISNLAVSQAYERKGVGSSLIDFVIEQAYTINQQFAGVKYITLAADEKAVGFYEKMEFHKLRDYFEIPLQQDNKGCIPMFMQMRHDFGDY